MSDVNIKPKVVLSARAQYRDNRGANSLFWEGAHLTETHTDSQTNPLTQRVRHTYTKTQTHSNAVKASQHTCEEENKFLASRK